MNQNNSFFKFLSIFIIGLILGFLISKINLNSISTPPLIISSNGSIKVMGSESAKITITEYSDFQCPLCRQYFNDTFPIILKNYVETGKVKYIFKHFPLNIHPQAPAAANASECALEQGKFWPMHDLLFQKQDQWADNTDHLQAFQLFAASLNLDTDKFTQCLDKNTFQGNIDADNKEALKKGFQGTPTFTINDQTIVGAQETQIFIDTIEKLLK